MKTFDALRAMKQQTKKLTRQELTTMLDKYTALVSTFNV